jgi:hypothetical protein
MARTTIQLTVSVECEVQFRAYSRHGALLVLSRKFHTEIAFMNTEMIGLTMMQTIMEATLNAEQLTTSALQLAKLHIAFEVDNGILKCSPKLFDARMSSLES